MQARTLESGDGYSRATYICQSLSNFVTTWTHWIYWTKYGLNEILYETDPEREKRIRFVTYFFAIFAEKPV